MCRYKLSIIIPTYNTAKHLERTINVLINQSLKDCEIIIVDDNSTDKTEEVVASFKKDHNNIKYLKNNKSLGAGISRNIGFECSLGKYTTFMDSDDWADLVAYETAVETLEKNPDCEIAIWGIKSEYNNKASSLIRTDYKYYNIINTELALSLLCNTYSLDVTISSYLGSKMFRSEFLKANSILFKSILFEDVVFSFKSILCAQNIILLPNIYTHYYQRPHSIVHSFTEKHIADMFAAFAYVREEINDEYIRYRNNFGSLVEKCSKTLFCIMYNNVEDPESQKKMLCCYFRHLLDFCSIDEIIEYIDSKRIKSILLNF